MNAFRRPRRRHLAILGMALVFAAIPAAPAGAADQIWAKAQDLSATQTDGKGPQVAIAEDGSAVAVWVTYDANPAVQRNRVQFAFRERGGNFQVPEGKRPDESAAQYAARVESTYLSDPGQAATTHVRLKMNKAGDAVVVWEGTDGSVRSAYKPATGAFGDEQIVKGGAAAEPEVGIEEQGEATVIYRGTGVRSASIYRTHIRTSGASGVWTGEQPLIDHPFGFGTADADPISYDERNGSLSVDEAGNAVAVITADHAPDDAGPRRQRVLEVYNPRGPDGWTITSQHDVGPTGHHSLHALIQGNSRLISWSRDGNLDVFVRSEGQPGGFFDRPSEPGDGPSATSGSAFLPEMALWATGSPNSLRARGFAFTGAGIPDLEVDPVPGNEGAGRTRPRLATDGDGTMMTVFRQRASNKTSIMAALHPKGDTSLRFNEPMSVMGADDTERSGAPVALSEPCDVTGDVNCDLEPDAGLKDPGPNVAMNSRGEAVVVWAQRDGNVNTVVKTSLFIPRPEPGEEPIPVPPPPPPRPETAFPSLIDTARPVRRGQATVLTLKSETQGSASDTAGATQLNWGFGSKSEPPITGEVVGGKLERGVRLRLPDESFTAKVRVQTPDGIKTFTRALTLPALPDTGAAGDVVKQLKKVASPPVFAVGATDTLTKASKACAPMKVWSGQQKMSGCMTPLEGLGDVPVPESGAVNEVAGALNLNETNKEVMQKATELTDGYVAEGRALLNDKFPVTPGGPASVVFNPQAKLMASANAQIPVGGGSFDLKKGFSVTLDPKAAKIPLGKLPKVPKLPSLAGLEVVGDWDVDLEKREAVITASVKLPPAIKKAGSQISNKVTLRATPERVLIDEVRVGPIDVDIAALKVNKFQIQYRREPDQWDGQGKACLIGTACLDMIPPNGGVTIRNGDLERAGATLIFPRPGLPLWAGVNLERVGFGLGLRPTRIFGNARVGVAQFIKLDGRIFVALPTSAEPFVMSRNEVGNDFPPHLYGSKFHRFTFGASAAALVDVPVIGETKLGSAYVVYEYPGYLAFGGGYDATVLDLVGIRGGIAAEADAEQGVFDIHGEVKACLYLADLDLCSGATGHVSRGRGGTGGGGACVDLGLVTVGGGVRWNDLDDPYIWPIDGCKWSPFRIQVRQSVAAARRKGKGPKASATRLVRGKASRAVLARESKVGVSQAGTYTIKVEKDKPSPVLRLDGVGTAPAIRVSGPGGVLEAPAGKGFVKTPDNKIRIMRYQGRLAKITSIGFQKADPGTYTVQVLPGSSPVVALRQATDPPDAKVEGRVSGKGRNRVFTYKAARRPSQKVVFSEVTASGAAQVIGSTTGGRGRIRFRSAPGSGRRTILAQFSLDGINVERKRVTTFKPQSPLIARPKQVRLRRKGGRLLVNWRRVPGATKYEVAVSPSSRRMTFATTRRTRAALKVPRWVSGAVTVRAIDDLRQSALARRSFRAVGSQPSPFRALQRCKIGKRKIKCLPPKRICAGRRATIVAEPGRVTRGTTRKDVIVGTDGNDRIDGRGGDDLICGGEGADTIIGGSGGDRIRGGGGADSLFGGRGADRLRGGPGDDRLLGEAGNDRLRGDAGNDSITGDSGRDKLSSGPNKDTLIGGGGNDRLNGGRGKDRLNGGAGRDRLRDGNRGRARTASP